MTEGTKKYTDHGPTQAFIERQSQAACWKKEGKCQGCGGPARSKDGKCQLTLCYDCLDRLGKQISAELRLGRHLTY